MFEVIKDGVRIALVINPTYICKSKNGCYALCSEGQAQGVVVDGVPYSIMGMSKMEDTEVVTLCRINGGKIIQDGITQGNDQNELMVDHEYRLTLLELGVTE